MPHDKNGELIQVGDTVTITCTVTQVQPSEDFCNCSVEVVDLMPPHGTKSGFSLSTKQVTKVQTQ